MSGTKTKLLMMRYSVKKDGTVSTTPSASFVAMINPADFKHKWGISYDKTKPFGEAVGDPKFAAVADETVNFSLLLDGTGAVPDVPPVPVAAQMALLNRVVYQYVGSDHEPPYVRLLWGTLIFFGRLETMNTQYTLFKPDGAPLRAKVDLAFVRAETKKAAALVANRSSPDLSHRVTVREGDTLPLLCERIYGDAGYYLDVASYNKLTDCRRLQPGRQLHFPPLE